MNKLLKEVKEQTWLFTDEQILHKIKEKPELDAEYIVLHLYKDKAVLTKEEYYSEIKQYVNMHCKEGPKQVECIFNQEKSAIDEFYEEASDDNDYFHAVKFSRNDMLNFLLRI